MPKADASHSDPNNFDLNLLRFLRALTDTASITRAGEALGLSQPAASRAMARLRQRFGDPLLARTGRGHVLTPLAQELAPAVRRALAATDTVFEAARFEAATSSRRFRLASTDYGMSVVVLPVLARLREAAPHCTLEVDPWSDETISALERGELDAALYADEPLPADFHATRLFDDGYALVCSPRHPLAQQRHRDATALLGAAAAYPQFAPRYPYMRHHVTDNVYAKIGLPSPPIALAAPYFNAGPAAAHAADLVALAPLRLARQWADAAGLALLPLRDPRLGFAYRIVWHERAHRDPGLVWLRRWLSDEVSTPAARAARRTIAPSAPP